MCGGVAYLDPDCGCVDLSGRRFLLWLHRQRRCNFDPAATEEDNSCQYPDCHGDCGGSAIQSDCGACVGGNTGLHGDACIDGCLTHVISTDSVACSPGLLHGQSFTAETTGRLEQVQLKVCCALDAQLALRRYVAPDPCEDGENTLWNTGDILGTSNVISATCTGLGNCLTSSGLDGYQWATFSFEDVYIQTGVQYILELTEGAALATCTPTYAGGQAFRESSAAAEADLAMAIFTCSGPSPSVARMTPYFTPRRSWRMEAVSTSIATGIVEAVPRCIPIAVVLVARQASGKNSASMARCRPSSPMTALPAQATCTVKPSMH